MLNDPRMKRHQSGLSTVEVAIVGAILLLSILAVVEIGRLFWVWESLTEATRRGARVAAVCPVNHAAIANLAVFNQPNGGGASAIIPGLDTTQVGVAYLDGNGTAVGNPAMDDWCDIRYVRVQINGYLHNFIVPGFGAFLAAPDFGTTIPSESLGLVPGVGFQCFGIPSPIPVCT